jgi:hypothetical protein
VLEELPIILADADPDLMKAIHIKRDVYRWHDDGRGAVVSSVNFSVAPTSVPPSAAPAPSHSDPTDA